MVRSRVDAECATGTTDAWSSSRTGDKGAEGICGSGKDSRCMLSAGRGSEGSLNGDWMLTERGEPGGVKRRPFTVRVAACLAGFASERLRPCRIFALVACLFGRPAGLRSLELFDRTSDTVASFIRRSDANGLLPLVFLRDDGRDPDGDGCGDRNGVDDDSYSSMSTAFSSRTIPRSSSGDGNPRLVRIFTARLRGETGGEGPLVSLGWAMEGMTRRRTAVCNKYCAAVNAMNHFESTYLGRVPRRHIASLNILKIASEDGRGRVNCANY